MYLCPASLDTERSVVQRDTRRIIRMMKTPEWARRAKERMRELEITQDDLKGTLGVKTRGAVGHYFTGRRKLSSQKAAALAKRLRLTVDELLTGRPPTRGVGITVDTTPGERIRNQRLEDGLSVEELASRLEWDPVKLEALESGDAQLAMPDALKLAEQLQCSCDWLLFGEGNSLRIGSHAGKTDIVIDGASKRQVELVQVFFRLPVAQQDAILNLIRSFSEERKAAQRSKSATLRGIALTPDMVPELDSLERFVEFLKPQLEFRGWVVRYDDCSLAVYGLGKEDEPAVSVRQSLSAAHLAWNDGTPAPHYEVRDSQERPPGWEVKSRRVAEPGWFEDLVPAMREFVRQVGETSPEEFLEQYSHLSW